MDKKIVGMSMKTTYEIAASVLFQILMKWHLKHYGSDYGSPAGSVKKLTKYKTVKGRSPSIALNGYKIPDATYKLSFENILHDTINPDIDVEEHKKELKDLHKALSKYTTAPKGKGRPKGVPKKGTGKGRRVGRVLKPKVETLYIPLVASRPETRAFGIYDTLEQAQKSMVDGIFQSKEFIKQMEEEYDTKISTKKLSYILYGNWDEVLNDKTSAKLTKMKTYILKKNYTIEEIDSKDLFDFSAYKNWDNENLYGLLNGMYKKEYGDI